MLSLGCTAGQTPPPATSRRAVLFTKSPQTQAPPARQGFSPSCIKPAVPGALQGTLSTEHSPQNEMGLLLLLPQSIFSSEWHDVGMLTGDL